MRNHPVAFAPPLLEKEGRKKIFPSPRRRGGTRSVTGWWELLEEGVPHVVGGLVGVPLDSRRMSEQAAIRLTRESGASLSAPRMEKTRPRTPRVRDQKGGRHEARRRRQRPHGLQQSDRHARSRRRR